MGGVDRGEGLQCTCFGYDPPQCGYYYRAPSRNVGEPLTKARRIHGSLGRVERNGRVKLKSVVLWKGRLSLVSLVL